MKEEIKEILELYKNDDIEYYNLVSDLGYDKLLDYITNLQEENERINNIIDELEKYIASEYYCFDNESVEFEVSKNILDKLKELRNENAK